VYTQSCDICQFTFSHVTYVSLYSVMLHMSVYTRSCEYVSLYSVMLDMSLYTRSVTCQFTLSHVTYVNLYSVM
jgi:hypothetical protein